MAIVYSYPLNHNIKILDELVGTTEQLINGQLKIVTRNFLLLDLIDFLIIDGGVQKQIELTTVGTSGAATLNQTTGVLNIPIYETALQDLQSVANIGYTTTTPIVANSFVKIGGTGNNVLLDNGTTIALSSVGGNTNLSYIQATDKGTVTSDTGTDAIIPLTDATNAGLFSATEKIKLGTIAAGAEVNVNADWNATSGDAQILNKPTISGTNTGDQNLQQVTSLGSTTTNPITIDGVVDNTGLTINLAGSANGLIISTNNLESIGYPIAVLDQNSDVSFAVYHDGDVLANKFIKIGGQVTQFLKADGSVDNNVYLTSADLPSTLDLYATTSPDPVIAGYTALVRNIADARYNTTAVNVPTPTITGTSVAPTFCGAVISDPSILLGNPGVFNFSVIGKIRRTGGPTSSGADFFFSIYKRDLAGIETLIANSAPVIVPANGGIYVEYISIALWNNGIFLSTDRVVLKFYGIKTGGGSGATYQFLFGGTDPVRGTAAISSAIIPNIYLKDLADVEKTPALNNEILYWNDADSLWEHSLAENLVPDASTTQKGLVTIGAQAFAGAKTFSTAPILSSLTASQLLATDASKNIQTLDTASYPSLTELSYSKGVISSIQTQLNSTVKAILNEFPNTSVTGFSAETLLSTFLIPANTFPVNCVPNFKMFFTKIGDGTGSVVRLYFNTTNNFATAQQLSSYSAAATTDFFIVTRNPIIDSGFFIVPAPTGQILSDETTIGTTVINRIFNPSIPIYFFISAQNGTALDTSTVTTLKAFKIIN